MYFLNQLMDKILSFCRRDSPPPKLWRVRPVFTPTELVVRGSPIYPRAGVWCFTPTPSPFIFSIIVRS